jgi:glycosyltransferase involved in cell wall biosynthesis
MPSPPHRRWVVLRETESITWGGDLRRYHLLERLAERTSAASIRGWGRPAIRQGVRATGGIPFPVRIGLGPRPALASTELLTIGAVVLALRHYQLTALDVHDHPVIQAEALGRPHPEPHRRALEERLRRNFDGFPILVVPSASFGDLAGVERQKAVVISNGTDTSHIRPGPFPEVPRVAFISGAAAGRGIEVLVDAGRRLRTQVRDLRLALWLTAVDAVGEAYIDGLRADVAGDPWIEIASAPYRDLSSVLATAAVLVVPNPANDYWDTAVPIKLMDSMAAGRPVVVTPRRETRRIVEEADAGRVAAGDGPDDLAAAILPLLEDAALAARLGANGRAAAERDYDWGILGERLADIILEHPSSRP